MKRFISAVALAVLCIAMLPKYAVAPLPPQCDKLGDVPIERVVRCYAEKYRVSDARMLATMRCESSLNPLAVGDGGHSYGLSQIHLPSHPSVTKEQAFDPAFASDFMARQFAAGNARIWTCYRNLFSVK